MGGNGHALDAPGVATGRSLVSFADDAADVGVRALEQGLGFAFATAPPEWSAPSGGGLVMPSLGTAVVDAPPEQVLAALAAHMDAILAVEPERIVYATERPRVGGPGNGMTPLPGPPATATVTPMVPAPAPALDPLPLPARVPSPPPGQTPAELHSYLRGYRDAVTTVLDSIQAAFPAPADAPGAVDESQATWGLQATKVPFSTRSGRGVRVALLDTGIDRSHPDFAGRGIVTMSFVPGDEAQDGHGHGTHCAGTAIGPRATAAAARYGIAYEAEVYVAKVLSNAGAGTDGAVLAAIAWAVEHRCAVVCLSLGAPVRRGQRPSAVFERAVSRALRQGSLIVAPAGTSGPGSVDPVAHPANCPSVLAVAALDATQRVAPFSNRGVNPDGGQVDIAAPGLDVFSSWPFPARYRRISGTSMAAAHVAGIAALHAETDPTIRGAALGRLVTASARRLPASSQDVGAGLAQAP